MIIDKNYQFIPQGVDLNMTSYFKMIDKMATKHDIAIYRNMPGFEIDSQCKIDHNLSQNFEKLKNSRKKL